MATDGNKEAAIAKNNEGTKLYLSGDYGGAAREFKAAIALDQDMKEAKENLKLANKKMGMAEYTHAKRKKDVELGASMVSGILPTRAVMSIEWIFEKIGYILAALIGLGLIVGLISILGWVGIVTLVVVALLIVLIQFGWLWFLK